ncbi:MAG TPA: matrixin family metalloprotease [Arthrobacter sp.]
MNQHRRSNTRLRFTLAFAALVGAAALVLTGFTFLPGTPTPGVGSSPAPLGRPTPLATASSSYTFLDASGTRPVSYDPCRAIHYVTRTANQPEQGPELVAEAIAAASHATGLVFINDGATDENPSARRASFQRARYGDRWAPMLITWQTSAEDWRFTNNGLSDVLGVSASESVKGAPGTPDAYVTGQLALNGPALQNMLSRDKRDAARAVVEHELGHILGLAHVSDPAQLMFEHETGAAYTYQAGDLAGLAQLGQGTCQPGI